MRLRRNPERLAWTVLTLALIMCLGVTLAVPLSLRSFVNDSFDVAQITLEVQQGTVLVRRAGQTEPIGVTTDISNLPEGTLIRADETVQALLTVRLPNRTDILTTVQIYGSTNLLIDRARTPRFDPSTQPHQIGLTVEGGRVRVGVSGGLPRPLEFTTTTPQAVTRLAEGSYAVDVTNDETQITVNDGQADVSAQGSVLTLGAAQRTIVRLGSRPIGILPPERNLVVNGNFRLPLDGSWEVTHDLQQSTETPGTVNIQALDGRRAAVFEREGTYHAETAMTQIIDRDVRDFRSLRLHFVVQINNQDVPVCGTAGSECPMMMRLDYKDNNGTDRSYFQGFYWLLDANGLNPSYNTTSGSRSEHIRVQRDFPFTYETDNLMPVLQPSQITAITFYASGHSWQANVAEIELLGEQ